MVAFLAQYDNQLNFFAKLLVECIVTLYKYTVTINASMSSICCKGIETRPCTGCGKYICPAGGHAEMYTYTDRKGKWGEYCYSCYERIERGDTIDDLEKVPRKILKDIEEQIDDKNIVNKIRAIFAHRGIRAKVKKDYSSDEDSSDEGSSDEELSDEETSSFYY
uniref:Uncharacterized protein n=1 Tax=Clandestinovirus TaxID=2831644 RepID=A0A8F8KSQ7_9VIRU|nr:hypothetical protein KOM_12_135 [Clandestinovirus]